MTNFLKSSKDEEKKEKHFIINSNRSIPSLRHCRGSVYYYLFAPQFHPSKTVYIYVDRDDTADSIYNKIKKFGYVNKLTGFQWMAKYKDFKQNIHTGRYAIRPNDNVYHVYSRFSRGIPRTYQPHYRKRGGH